MGELTAIVNKYQVLFDIVSLLELVAMWIIFTKAGKKGWEAIIPFYNTYCLFDIIYGDGWKFLMLLIPFYNIYLLIKMNIDLAHKFNQSTGFGWGLVFVHTIFIFILAFGSSAYMDGSYEQNDTISNFASNVRESVNNAANKKEDNQAFEAIAKLNELHESGAITDEEFETKKQELLKKI